MRRLRSALLRRWPLLADCRRGLLAGCRRSTGLGWSAGRVWWIIGRTTAAGTSGRPGRITGTRARIGTVAVHRGATAARGRERVLRVGGSRRRHRCRLGRLLLRAGLHLGDDRARIDPAAVKLALERQQILGVVLPQRVRRTAAGTDSQHSGNVLPRFALGNLKKTAAFLHQDVQLVQIQGRLGDGRTGRDGRAALLHEGEQLIQPGPPLRLVVHVVQLVQAVRFLSRSKGSLRGRNVAVKYWTSWRPGPGCGRVHLEVLVRVLVVRSGRRRRRGVGQVTLVVQVAAAAAFARLGRRALRVFAGSY